MPTEHDAPVALFLFAHQDDEFGVFQRIVDCRCQGLQVLCSYLTDGAAAATAAQRNAESIHVLTQLGVAYEDIAFAGERMAIPDGGLPDNLENAGQWIRLWLASFARIDSIHVPAWEGGHHDHDALHALVACIAQERGLLPRVHQYSLYHAAGCLHPFFRVLSPLARNGPVKQRPIPWRARWRYLRLCLCYPSQMITWIGLLPFILLRYLTHGTQDLQAVSIDLIEQQPHPGILYYEKRKFFTWKAMQQRISIWRATMQGDVNG